MFTFARTHAFAAAPPLLVCKERALEDLPRLEPSDEGCRIFAREREAGAAFDESLRSDGLRQFEPQHRVEQLVRNLRARVSRVVRACIRVSACVRPTSKCARASVPACARVCTCVHVSPRLRARAAAFPTVQTSILPSAEMEQRTRPCKGVLDHATCSTGSWCVSKSSTSPLHAPPARTDGSVGWNASDVKLELRARARSALEGSMLRRKTDHVHSTLSPSGQLCASNGLYAAATTVPDAFHATAEHESSEDAAAVAVFDKGTECLSACKQSTWSCCSSQETSCLSKALEFTLRSSCSSSSGVLCSKKL
eukprot:1208266-Pleurochrysis_carterae.AAC.1